MDWRTTTKPLLYELHPVVGLEALDVAAMQTLPRAELTSVIRQRVEAFLVKDHVDFLVSHRAEDLIAHAFS